jgi:hypothetical protein
MQCDVCGERLADSTTGSGGAAQGRINCLIIKIDNRLNPAEKVKKPNLFYNSIKGSVTVCSVARHPTHQPE